MFGVVCFIGALIYVMCNLAKESYDKQHPKEFDEEAWRKDWEDGLSIYETQKKWKNGSYFRKRH